MQETLTTQDFTALHNQVIPDSQRKAMLESREHMEVLEEITSVFSNMPELYETEGNNDPMIMAHYFYGGFDWWIIERRKEDNLCYGYVNFNDPKIAELSYIDLKLLFKDVPLVNLDFFWTPIKLSEIKSKLL